MYFLALAIGIAQAVAGEPASDDHGIPVSEDSAPRLVVLCDPARFRFSVRADADDAGRDRSYPRRIVVDPDELSQALPGWTGSPDIRGPLVRYVRCGPYTIKLEGDAYNSNVQGESGAYPGFAALRIIRANRTVYPQGGGAGRLTECDRTLPRARPCPDGYAIRIDGNYIAAGKKLELTETVSSTAGDDPATRRTAIRHLSVDEDLTNWPAGIEE